MKLGIQTGDICKVGCDAIVCNIFEKETEIQGELAEIDSLLGGAISKMIASGEISGKLNEINVIRTLGKMNAGMILIAGAGNKDEFNSYIKRNLSGEVIQALKKHKCKIAAETIMTKDVQKNGIAETSRMVAEGVLLGSYKFDKHLTSNKDKHEIEKFILVAADKNSIKPIRDGMQKGIITAEAAMLARDMVNEPANYLTPTHMARTATSIAKENELDLVIMDKKDMEKEKMGALLGVARGSSEPPMFIVLKYKGDKSTTKTLGLVGKGITFDSGGISLKTQEYMSDMKGDMAGGAVVMAAICAIARMKLKINVTAVIPATENLPGGRALKPGDVVKASNGKTIEVLNTDAEGRLILADALAYAVKEKLSPIIDVATLTGACHVALGDMYAGIFSPDDQLAKQLMAAGDIAGEYLWRLPLPKEYVELIKSDIADVKNTGGRYGGAITAALFLKEFVDEVPWAHIDIAGPFMSEKVKGAMTKGGTGFGVRTLISYVENFARKGK